MQNSKYVYPSQNLKAKVLQLLKDMNLTYKVGTILTTDAFFRTTKEEVEFYKKEGVLGVEMETAGILSVAEFNKVDAIAIFTTTDSYATKEWKKPLDYREKKLKALGTFFDIALKTAK